MSKPLISIIIPTYNRQKELAHLLSSIAGLKGKLSEIEVVVVDDGSEVPVKDSDINPAGEVSLTLLSQVNQGAASARNYGAREARGEFYAFLDDDCTLPVDWYVNVVSSLSRKSMVIGRTVNVLVENVFSEASQVLTQFLFSYFNSDRSNAKFITSNNMITPRSLFREIGGFSCDFPGVGAEDRDFCDRWLDAGYSICFAEDILVEHHHKLSLRRFLRQHYNYGKGAAIYHRKRRMRKAETIKIEPLHFYFDMLTYPWREHKPLNAISLSICMFLSQACNAGGYYLTLLQHRIYQSNDTRAE